MRAHLVTLGLAGAGGALGSCLRLAVSLGALHLWADGFLWATFAANIAGSALIGWLSMRPLGVRAAAFWMTGFCGGVTTFSTLSLESAVLASRGDWVWLIAYVTLSLLGSVLAVGVARRWAR